TAIPVNPADITRFADIGYTDSYVKVIFRRPGVRYPEPLDLALARAMLPREQWPPVRSFTLREVNRQTTEITIDFVYHGDIGLAGPWAAAAMPGTEFMVAGPGGTYAPDPTADWHLMIGDETALPAIAASLTRVPAGALVHAAIEVWEPSDRQNLACPGEPRLEWFYRSERPELETALVDYVQTLRFPPGRVHAFVHGEANAVKQIRRHLLHERGLLAEQLSISGYWRRGYDDEAYRGAKAAERAEETISV
ncbi:MAG: siderophore-interacting protein, partial [Pseudonocardia sp.]|nr:siderophore-interacting protein [Pseudonocardia sp.]